jgi:hypothetical protein
MVYTIRDYRVFGLCPSSVIPNYTMFRQLIYFHPQVRGWEIPTMLDPLERDKLIHWTVLLLTKINFNVQSYSCAWLSATPWRRMGEWNYSPPILKLGTRWRSVLTLTSLGPFYLDDYKMTENFIYNWFSVIFIQNLIFLYYFNFIIIYNIVFHCLGRAIRCLCGHFWILAEPRSLELWHLRAVINLARVQDTRRAYKSQWSGPPNGPLWLSCLGQTSLREMEWRVYVRTVENSNFLEFPAWDVQAIATLLTLSSYSEGYGCDPCTLRDPACRSVNTL